MTVRLHSLKASGGDAQGGSFPYTIGVAYTDAEGLEQAESLPDVENLIGSTHNDILAGDRNDNDIGGGAGNDTLYGGPGGGDDVMADGSNASCEEIISHPVICNPVTDRVNGACGTSLNTCNPGDSQGRQCNESWLCRGICGGTDANCDHNCAVCRLMPPDGDCGDTLNTCANGPYQSVSGSPHGTVWAPNPPGTGIDALGCDSGRAGDLQARQQHRPR